MFSPNYPAFPCAEDAAGGLTIREWFACSALQGLIASQPPPHPEHLGDADNHYRLAKEAVAFADALIDQLWTNPAKESV